jgi:hypothetical protein
MPCFGLNPRHRRYGRVELVLRFHTEWVGGTQPSSLGLAPVSLSLVTHSLGHLLCFVTSRTHLCFPMAPTVRRG